MMSNSENGSAGALQIQSEVIDALYDHLFENSSVNQSVSIRHILSEIDEKLVEEFWPAGNANDLLAFLTSSLELELIKKIVYLFRHERFHSVAVRGKP
jgi:hypothetical protein